MRTKNLDDMIHSSRYIQREGLTLAVLDHFLPFYPPKNLKNQNFEKMKKLLDIVILHVYQKSQSYNVQFLRYRVIRTEFFVILGHFLALYPSNNPENQNFEKMKKAPGDVIILHMCTKNHDHMTYVS